MDHFETYYTELGVERAELFKLIQKRYRCTDVLYPGCSIHITPSLFFPHVIYADTSDEAGRFFAGEQSVLGYINRHKHYKRSAYLRFIRQDYLKPLPVLEGAFDLVLALFAGGVARSCKTYLKPGGMLLTNNHQNDAADALHDEELQLSCQIKFQRGQYVMIEGGTDAIQFPVQKSYKITLRRASRNVEDSEHEIYYVFERTSL